MLRTVLVLLQVCAASGASGASDFWTATPRYSLDLHSHGYKDSDQNGPLGDGVELAFASNSTLFGAIVQTSKAYAIPPTNVFAFDLKRGSVIEAPEIPVGPFLFCPIAGNRVALAAPRDIRVCSEQLVCAVALKPGGKISASPLGSRLVITRRPGTPRVIIDTGTWKTFSEVPLRLPLSKVTLGDEHILAPTEDGPEFAVDERKRVRFVGMGPIAEIRFLDSKFVAVTQYGRSDVSVFDLDGNLKYVIKTDSPNRASLLVAAAGGRFGVVVARQTMANLLGLSNGRRDRSLRVNVIETATGKQVAEFESNAPAGSEFALSPNGRLLASEREGKLRVVEIP